MKCKKCNSDFEIPKNAIEMVFSMYCLNCIKKAQAERLKMPMDECMKLIAKQLGL